MAAFKTFSMHATERDGKTAFAALKTERADYASFGGPGPSQMQLDPETAARRIVEQALDSDSVPSFTVSEAKGKKPELKSLGTETQPLTGTRIVKFRQFYNKVPVYSSLITVELDEVVDVVVRELSQHQALSLQENLHRRILPPGFLALGCCLTCLRSTPLVVIRTLRRAIARTLRIRLATDSG